MTASTAPGTGSRWRWDEATGEFYPESRSAGVRIVDSWLVDAGRVRGLAEHAGRFRAACTRLFGLPADRTTRFLRAAGDRLPDTGRWFPRVELALDQGEARFQLWLRPAPPRGTAVRLWYPGEPDRRCCPGVKGIDLDQLAELRAAALAAGGDEPVLLSSAGHVLEGATTSIVWWRGSVLCGPPAGPELLPGITRTLLSAVAGAAGHPVVSELATPEELAGIPVWTVNSLHGIRPVTGWLGLATELPAPPDSAPAVAHWQACLDRLAEPVHLDVIRLT